MEMNRNMPNYHDPPFNAILDRIKANDATLKCLNIFRDGRSTFDREQQQQQQETFTFSSLKKHMRRFPGLFTRLLSANTAITSLSIRVPVIFGDVHQKSDNWVLEDTPTLARCIGEMSSLLELILDGEDERDRRDEQAQAAFMSMLIRHCRGINTLKFSCTKCSPVTADAINECLQHHRSLEILEFSIHKCGSIINMIHSPISSCLPTLSKLRSIRVKNVGSFQQVMLFDFPDFGLRSITELSIENKIGCVLEGGTIRNNFITALRSNPNLSTLNIGSCPQDVMFFDTLSRVVRSNTNLIELGLEACKVVLNDDDDDEENRNNNEDLSIYAVGLSQLLNNINFYAANRFKTLCLRNFHFNQSHLEQLVSLISASTSLESLVLGIRGNLSDQTWGALTTSIGNNSTLKHVELDLSPLDYSSEPISMTRDGTRQGLINIAASTTLKRFKYIYPSSLPQQDNVWSYLIPSLDIKTSALEELILGVEELNLETGEQLVKTLSKNYTITNLEFERHGTRDIHDCDKARIKKSLDIICELNKHGRHYIIKDPGTKHKGVELLAAIAKEPILYKYVIHFPGTRTVDLRLDCLYFHLLENPFLCETS